ncbi:MAG: carbohydrate ABC transporter permease [Clostridia bacterium]|nr:carbohydrate ABC transporter permease [Clostridia bacterium]
MVRSSLLPMAQIFRMPPIWIPNPPQFGNYSQALRILPFGRYLGNTLTILIPTMVGTLLTSSISAYAFARIEWPGRDIWFGLIITGMMLPYAVTLIPTFLGWKLLGAYGSYYPLIVPSWFGGGAFNIFMLRQFYMTIPHELDEAAYMDGAGHLRIYFFILLPLIKSALIVVGLFTFIRVWNDFLGPLVYLKTEKQFTLAIGLQQFVGQYTAQWHLLMAASTLVALPTVTIYLIGQRYFVEGIALTGLKG